MQATWLSPVWLGDKERMLIPETFLWLLHSITRFSKKWLRFIEQNAIKSHACFHHLLWSGRPLMLEQLTTTLWPPRIYLFLYLFLECFPLSLFLSWMTRSLLKWIFFLSLWRDILTLLQFLFVNMWFIVFQQFTKVQKNVF